MSFRNLSFIVLFFVWSLYVQAITAAPASVLASSSISASSLLPTLVDEVLAEHPEVRAAEAALVAAQARARAAGRPLYNPELELDAERTGVNTTSLGLSQTIDWADKREARHERGNSEMRAARAAHDQVRQQVAREVLDALSRYHTGERLARLAQRRVALLEDFLQLAQRRFAAGDVGQSDVDLARLALSEARMAAAGRASALAEAEANLRALVSRVPASWPHLPALPPAHAAQPSETLLAVHPRLREALALSRAARAGVELARRERRPDPTLGLRGGREEEDSLIGLTLTIPLFVRNPFRAEVEAAAAEARRSEADSRNLRRRVWAAMAAAADRYRLTRQALVDWERSGRPSLQGRVKLLQRLWESGEINTTEYLVQLQQTLNTELAAVELEAEAWSAWVNWLAASGQVLSWLGFGEVGPAQEAAAHAAGGEGGM